MRLTLLGTGLMGAPMARRWLHSGHHLTVWNRTREKAAALADHGAHLAESPEAAVANAEVVLTILENGPVVRSVLIESPMFNSLRPGMLVVDMSSIGPEEAREHAARLSDLGVAHLDAPVSGGPSGAEEGKLAIMVGGSRDAFIKAEPVLRQVGSPVLVGPAGSGQFAKLTSQMIASTALAAVAEALLLARAEGIDPLQIRQALAGGFADSKILQLHGRRMVERDFVPGGHVRTFIKDLASSRRIAFGRGLDLPVTELAFEIFSKLSERGCDEYDIASVALEMEARNNQFRIGSGPDRLPPT